MAGVLQGIEFGFDPIEHGFAIDSLTGAERFQPLVDFFANLVPLDSKQPIAFFQQTKCFANDIIWRIVLTRVDLAPNELLEFGFKMNVHGPSAYQLLNFIIQPGTTAYAPTFLRGSP